MNKTANRQAICEVLMARARTDRDVVVLCSDSRGSASLAPFFQAFPEQSVEIGIAEQDLVSIAAGLAKCGKKAYAASPACFLSTRSYEQAKVDVAYSNTNVKLIGISGGVSYGALGMSHHSCQDIAVMAAIPNMRVYLPSDRFQTAKLIEALLDDEKPAYIRVGRNPVEDIYTEERCPFALDRATVLRDSGAGRETCAAAGEMAQACGNRAAIEAASAEGAGRRGGADVLLVACGEMVAPALKAAELLVEQGIESCVLDMYCVKPLDTETLLKKAAGVRAVVTVEEHAPTGGLGSMVAQAVAANDPKRVVNLTLPDAPVITGTSREVFDYYGLNAEGIAAAAKKALGLA